MKKLSEDNVEDSVECVDCVSNFYNDIMKTLNELRNLTILDDESYERAKMNLDRIVFGVEY